MARLMLQGTIRRRRALAKEPSLPDNKLDRPGRTGRPGNSRTALRRWPPAAACWPGELDPRRAYSPLLFRDPAQYPVIVRRGAASCGFVSGRLRQPGRPVFCALFEIRHAGSVDGAATNGK